MPSRPCVRSGAPCTSCTSCAACRSRRSARTPRLRKVSRRNSRRASRLRFAGPARRAPATCAGRRARPRAGRLRDGFGTNWPSTTGFVLRRAWTSAGSARTAALRRARPAPECRGGRPSESCRPRRASLRALVPRRRGARKCARQRLLCVRGSGTRSARERGPPKPER